MVRGWISRILKIHRIFCCTRFVEKGMANIEGTYYIYLAVSAESRDITGLFKIKHCLDGEHKENRGNLPFFNSSKLKITQIYAQIIGAIK